MKNKVKLLLLICAFCLNNVFGQNFSANIQMPDMSGLNTAGSIGAVLVGGALILGGNEVHTSYNYAAPSLIWDKKKDNDVKGGSGFNIELRRTITEQQRIIYGFQRNNYTKTVYATAQETKHYDYIYVGYTHDIYESKQGIWKPYLGVNGILSDETVSAALLIGSRWSIGKTCQLESRITASKKNLNAQLGINMRYRKSKSSKVN